MWTRRKRGTFGQRIRYLLLRLREIGMNLYCKLMAIGADEGDVSWTKRIGQLSGQFGKISDRLKNLGQCDSLSYRRTKRASERNAPIAFHLLFTLRFRTTRQRVNIFCGCAGNAIINLYLHIRFEQTANRTDPGKYLFFPNFQRRTIRNALCNRLN